MDTTFMIFEAGIARSKKLTAINELHNGRMTLHHHQYAKGGLVFGVMMFSSLTC